MSVFNEANGNKDRKFPSEDACTTKDDESGDENIEGTEDVNASWSNSTLSNAQNSDSDKRAQSRLFEPSFYSPLDLSLFHCEPEGESACNQPRSDQVGS